MYCSNCGHEVHEKAIACPKCGVPPRLEKKYCPNCGIKAHAEQFRCAKCGFRLPATVPLKEAGDPFYVIVKAISLGYFAALGLFVMLGALYSAWPHKLLFLGIPIPFYIGSMIAGHIAKKSGGLCGGIVGFLSVLSCVAWWGFNFGMIDAVNSIPHNLRTIPGIILFAVWGTSKVAVMGHTVGSQHGEAIYPPKKQTYDQPRRSPTWPGIKAEFIKRRLINHATIILAVAVGLPLLFTADKHPFGLVGILLIVGYFIINYLNWRCPECNKSLEGNPLATFCKHCGANLFKGRPWELK